MKNRIYKDYKPQTYEQVQRHSHQFTQMHQKNNTEQHNYKQNNWVENSGDISISNDCQEYSFNVLVEGQKNRLSDSTLKTNSEVANKYSSLCKELSELDTEEIIHLFIQEIQQNEQNKSQIAAKQRRINMLETQLQQYSSMLKQKRQVIQKLCETESNNLDLIQTLQQRMKHFNFDFNQHYHQKYRQLQSYMNQYIGSAKQAQQQLIKSMRVIKQDNRILQSQNQQMQRQLFQKSKIVAIFSCKRDKKDQIMELFKQKERKLYEEIRCLEEENLMLKKDIEMLVENIKNSEQFQISINKQNKQLSSSFDFIREKLNCYSPENLDKKEEEKNEATQRKKGPSNADTQKEQFQMTQLQMRIVEINSQNQKLIGQNEVLAKDNKRLKQRGQELLKDNNKLINLVDEKNAYIAKLKKQMENKTHLQVKQKNCPEEKIQRIQSFYEQTENGKNQKQKNNPIKQNCYNDSLNSNSGSNSKIGWSQSTTNSKGLTRNNSNYLKNWKNEEHKGDKITKQNKQNRIYF